MSQNPAFETFKHNFPKAYIAFNEMYQSVSSTALDEKTKQLVYLGVLTALRYSPAIRVHISKEIHVGATENEVLEAMMMSIPAGGLCNFLSVLPDVLDELNGK
ncbi:carboxymuconolactone decarboxylase family protein [Paenibacillus wynnii]|uniref:carboxymuconolactone decarboxylase family protein n=1 Tax=Paenibacillus wynnii TaxID=268407 RepID=UPI0027938E9B|nr:carboxymuconolactone decarboxylase family protein [Paenibacillus wynnii]MDQ0193557.1 alkylhydroperoxidase/carboxymuconolactone decarboxylase family protein YurZ [Paenibacillus wynnii]